MRTLPLTDAKARLSELIDQVERRDERVTITRNGRPVAVLVSPDELEGWQETLEIVKDAPFMEGIRRGLVDLKRGRSYTLREVDAILAEDKQPRAKGRRRVSRR